MPTVTLAPRPLLLLGGGALLAAALQRLCRDGLLRRREAAQEAQEAGALDGSLAAVLEGRLSLAHWCAHRGYAGLLRWLPRGLGLDAACGAGGWRPLHVAATAGHAAAAAALLRRGAAADAADGRGHTALEVAAARGHATVVAALLAAGADAGAEDPLGGTALHYAAGCGDTAAACEVVRQLLRARADPNAADGNGGTPLSGAVVASWPVAELLLQAGARPGAAEGSRAGSPLMLVVTKLPPAEAEAAARALLRYRADPNCRDGFGAMALHKACRRGADGLGAIRALCEGGADILAQDNDGLYAMQLLTEQCAKQPEDAALASALAAMLAAEPAAAGAADFGDATALHTLCLHASLEGKAPLAALRALLAARADPCAEEEGGFAALHFAAAAGAAAAPLLAELRAALEAAGRADAWAAVDWAKTRDTSNSKYLARRGAHNRIPLEDRAAVLPGGPTLAAAAERLRSGRSRRVVCVVGAGISTSAGVPDFRSPGTGLWASESTRDTFSLEGFMNEPERFWSAACEMFLGRSPTPFHRLLAELASRGLLHRVYTQNVDNLEVDAGVPPELVVECHGNATRTVCSRDREHRAGCASLAEVREQLAAGRGAPRCRVCGALVRPDIVFFFEPLPPQFARRSSQDLQECDLLLVAGSTLMVYPVAGLVNQVGPLTPRLLLNREAVGPWRNTTCGEGAAYRDAFFQGPCDRGALELARELGWDLGV